MSRSRSKRRSTSSSRSSKTKVKPLWPRRRLFRRRAILTWSSGRIDWPAKLPGPKRLFEYCGRAATRSILAARFFQRPPARVAFSQPFPDGNTGCVQNPPRLSVAKEEVSITSCELSAKKSHIERARPPLPNAKTAANGILKRGAAGLANLKVAIFMLQENSHFSAPWTARRERCRMR